MDSYREHPSEFDGTGGGGNRRRPRTSLRQSAPTSGACTSAPIIIGCRCSTAATSRRSRTSSPSNVTDFAPNSILLDFTCGRDNPAMPYIGNAIREECGLDEDVRTIADVPSRSLLSRLTDHYLQIIANRAPIGFEAEFVNQRGEHICYRGILMPFSSDGDTIDFIYGVINWKAVGASRTPGRLLEPEPIADEPVAVDDRRARSRRASAVGRRPLDEEPVAIHAEADEPAPPAVPFDWEADADEDEIAEIAEIVVERRCRPRRPAVGRARDRRGRQVGRRPQPRRALSRAWRWPMISPSPRSATPTNMPSCSRIRASRRRPARR